MLLLNTAPQKHSQLNLSRTFFEIIKKIRKNRIAKEKSYFFDRQANSLKNKTLAYALIYLYIYNNRIIYNNNNNRENYVSKKNFFVKHLKIGVLSLFF